MPGSREVPALDLRFPAAPGLDDAIAVALHDLSPAAVHEIGPEDAPLWRVFFASAAARDAAAVRLFADFAPQGLTLAPLVVADEDWAARSQATLGHVRVGRVVVAPPWDVPAIPPEDVLVIIKPSMGFGTGHHESTRLCLRLLQSLDLRGRRVIDAGTGSGVLAIAAARLGAGEVVAFDMDADAVDSARENLLLNSEGDAAMSGRVRLAAAALGDPFPPADVLLANLTGATLMASAASLASMVSRGGHLVVSGFQAHESDAVLHAFDGLAAGVRLEAEEGWRAALLQLSPR